MRLSLSADKSAQPLSMPCSTLTCSGAARFETICGGPAYCGHCWRRYVAARTVQAVLYPDGDRTAMWWWHCYINSADNGQIALLLRGLHLRCGAVVVAVDDIDRRCAQLQTMEVSA
jgi:hypothetical protein